jgi:ATP-dependent DNA ligase
MLYDISQHGKRPIDLATTPYAERRQLLEGIVPHLPPGKFHLAPQVEGPEAIGKLYDDVVSGRHPLTREGAVIHPPTGRPLKVKQTDEHDVVVTGVFPGEGRRGSMVGGLTFAHPEDPEKTVGRVGTGFDEETLRQIAADPQAFIGRTARLKAQERYPTGALRAPVMLAWHEG